MEGEGGAPGTVCASEFSRHCRRRELLCTFSSQVSVSTQIEREQTSASARGVWKSPATCRQPMRSHLSSFFFSLVRGEDCKIEIVSTYCLQLFLGFDGTGRHTWRTVPNRRPCVPSPCLGCWAASLCGGTPLEPSRTSYCSSCTCWTLLQFLDIGLGDTNKVMSQKYLLPFGSPQSDSVAPSVSRANCGKG